MNKNYEVGKTTQIKLWYKINFMLTVTVTGNGIYRLRNRSIHTNSI